LNLYKKLMSMTERLYYQDSHLTEFEAQVVAVTPRTSGWATVTLDRTAFYPTGGGQPSDTGTLDDARVVECIDEEAEGVLHVIHGASPQVGALVRGRVDWDRRQDHMQQHTGQHLLSQAFIELFRAETRGFRMMEQASEIDLALDHPSDEKIERAVSLANRIIWEDRPVIAREVTRDEAARLSLRKESEREGLLRLIEIEGFDLTPCGGTHAHRTGEVGILAVRSWERAKGMTRLEFVAGQRALTDYRRVNRVAREVAAQFSVGLDEVSPSVTRLFEENKSLQRRVHTLEEIAARVEAEELLRDEKQRVDNVRVVARVFEGRDAESLKQLAFALISHERTIALLGSRDKEAARLIFARSSETEGDMNSLMREACAMLDGRGGGRPELAQGGGHAVDKLEAAIDEAARKLGVH
jgi:alanyl-tRNA synthetase